MLDDPKEPLKLSTRNVFFWGAAITAILVVLIFLYVPKAPERTEVERSYLENDAPVDEDASAGGGSPAASAEVQGAVSGPRSAESNYQTYCAQCHGQKGDGNAPLARMMAVRPPNLITGPYKYQRSLEAVAALIEKGVGAMPGFGEELTSEESQALAELVLGMETAEETP